MWQTHDMGSGWWLLTAVMLVALIALVIWLVTTYSSASERRTSPPQSAIDILDRRLAAGDITVEDYEERRRALASERGRSTVSGPG